MTTKHTRPNPRFVVSLTEKQSSEIHKLAKEQDVTCSSVIRRSVRCYLKRRIEAQNTRGAE